MTELLSRRSALRGLAITGGAAVVGFAVARTKRPASTRGATTAANGYGAARSGGRLLAPLAKVPTGGGLVVGKAKVVLTRPDDQTLLAFSAVCTHQGCLVADVTATAISCPCHGSQFDPRTGAVTAGPATRPLAPVSIEVKGTDVYSS